MKKKSDENLHIFLIYSFDQKTIELFFLSIFVFPIVFKFIMINHINCKLSTMLMMPEVHDFYLIIKILHCDRLWLEFTAFFANSLSILNY